MAKDTLPPDVRRANELQNIPRVLGDAGRVLPRQSLKLNSKFTNSVFTLIGVSVSRQVLVSNPFREYFLVQNKSASNLWVSFGTEASTANGILIGASGYYEPYRVPLNEVYVYGPGAYGVIVEGV